MLPAALALLSSAAIGAPPPQLSFGAAPEPYEALHGGAFVGGGSARSPDPLAAYHWDERAPGFNGSALQIYGAGAVAVSTRGARGVFGNTASLLPGGSGVLAVNMSALPPGAAATLVLDFGVERAAWFELDSADLPDALLGGVRLAVGEYDAPWNQYNPWVDAWQSKGGRPTRYDPPGGAGASTFRLELNDELYEGARYAFLTVNASAAAATAGSAAGAFAGGGAFTVRACRLVCQVSARTSYSGNFSAGGGGPDDALLERVWWTGAYTARLNVLPDALSAILVDRGDRFSWTGDAHVTQATLMAAFGGNATYELVRRNLYATRTNSNGIQSYALYWVLSVADYWRETADADTLCDLLRADAAADDDGQWTPKRLGGDIAARLALSAGMLPDPGLGFYGWDDRIGGGFETVLEAQRAYTGLAARSHAAAAAAVSELLLQQQQQQRQRGGVCGAAGPADANLTALARAWNATAAQIASDLRAREPDWASTWGLHATADAVAAGMGTGAERAMLLRKHFLAPAHGSADVCSYSPFNSFFLLGALGDLLEEQQDGQGQAAAVLEAYVLRCWGGMIEMGATTFWEVFSSEWQRSLTLPNGTVGAVPWAECGATSMAHPWSSGATCWLSRRWLGVSPSRPGYAAFAVRPLALLGLGLPSAPAVARSWQGSVPTPHGAVRVRVERSAAGAATLCTVAVASAPGTNGTLHLPLRPLLARFAASVSAASASSSSSAAAAAAAVVVEQRLPASGPHAGDGSGASGWREVWRAGSAEGAAARLAGSTAFVAVASGIVGTGAEATFRVRMVGAPPARSASSSSSAPALPPPTYETAAVYDNATSGNWIGVHGAAGYVLPGFCRGAANDSGTVRAYPAHSGASDVVRLPAHVSGVAYGFTNQDEATVALTEPDPAADARALLAPHSAQAPGGRRAIGAWAAPYTFSIDVTLTADGDSRAVATSASGGAPRRTRRHVLHAANRSCADAPCDVSGTFLSLQDGCHLRVAQNGSGARQREYEVNATCGGTAAWHGARLLSFPNMTAALRIPGEEDDRIATLGRAPHWNASDAAPGACSELNWGGGFPYNDKWCLAPFCDSTPPPSPPPAPPAPGPTRKLTLYFVDWERVGRRMAVRFMDFATKELLAPTEVLGPETLARGVHLTIEHSRSVRVRVSHIDGFSAKADGGSGAGAAVLSAVFFD